MYDLTGGDDAAYWETDEAIVSDAHAETPALVSSMCGLVSTAALHALLDTACRNIHFILSFFANAQSHIHE